MPTALFLLCRIAIFSLAVRDIISHGHACVSTTPKFELLIDGIQRRTRAREYDIFPSGILQPLPMWHAKMFG